MTHHSVQVNVMSSDACLRHIARVCSRYEGGMRLLNKQVSVVYVGGTTIWKVRAIYVDGGVRIYKYLSAPLTVSQPTFNPMLSPKLRVAALVHIAIGLVA